MGISYFRYKWMKCMLWNISVYVLWQFVGEPCGQHGPYTFYRAVRCSTDEQWLTFRLGRFFPVTIASCDDVKTTSLSAVGELQLLWVDRNHEGQKLASVRLYILPEDCPTGRLPGHGQVGTNELFCNLQILLFQQQLHHFTAMLVTFLFVSGSLHSVVFYNFVHFSHGFYVK